MNFLTALVVTGVTFLTGTGCSSAPEPRSFPLHGQVLSVADDRRQATIKHEEIKGLMAGMTMTFTVKDPQLLSGIKPGDVIDATLVVEENGAHLSTLKKVGEAPIEAAPAPAASSGFELLKPGETVPEAQFVDQDGKPRAFSSFKGSPLAITFIYTKCPFPDFCPLMDRQFRTIQQALETDTSLQKAHLLSVSFDPITDTPAVLKAHADALKADPARWTFVTGDRDQIDQFASRFGVSITRSPTDPIDIAHNLRTAIVDAEGRLVKAYTGNEWKPADVLADLKGVGAK
jgi:protein SCO1/2